MSLSYQASHGLMGWKGFNYGTGWAVLPRSIAAFLWYMLVPTVLRTHRLLWCGKTVMFFWAGRLYCGACWYILPHAKIWQLLFDALDEVCYYCFHYFFLVPIHALSSIVGVVLEVENLHTKLKFIELLKFWRYNIKVIYILKGI